MDHDTLSRAADQLDETASAASEQARRYAEDGKNAGADRLEGLARAFGSAADQIEGEMPQAASAVRAAATRVERFSRSLRDKSTDQLVHEANDFARNNAVVFFGASLIAGFALARFLKSSGKDAKSSGKNAGAADARLDM